jgi:acetyl-CoA carboxylase alpha subunit
MIQPREVIYGVCDKTGTCDSYFGFFKRYEDAQKEVKIQANRLKEDLGLMDIIVKEDRAVTMKTDRIEQLIIIIHNYVLR